ncbi:MAG: FMN-binding protein [Proteobacteria bacterium]|nr:FMN-binding protein [Pseudomonadota bacterium]
MRSTTFLLCFSSLLWLPHARGKVVFSLPEALEHRKGGHPGSEWKSENHYLTGAQLELAKSLSGVRMNGALVVRNVLGTAGGKPLLYAYTDTHKVRSHPETVMVFVTPEGAVDRVEVLQFDEPLEYLPKSQWYDTFHDAKLDPELDLKRKIPLVTGASLSAKSVVEATRRILSLHRVIGAGAGQGAPK